MSKLPALCILLVAAVSFSRPNDAWASPKIVVLELRLDNRAIPLDSATVLTDIVRTSVVTTAGSALRVLSKEKVFEILRQFGTSAASCSADCQIQTVQEIGADYFVAGSIAKAGGQLVMTLEVKRARDGALVAAKQVMQDDEKALMKATAAGAAELVVSLLQTLAHEAASLNEARKPPSASGAEGQSVRPAAVGLEPEELGRLPRWLASTSVEDAIRGCFGAAGQDQVLGVVKLTVTTKASGQITDANAHAVNLLAHGPAAGVPRCIADAMEALAPSWDPKLPWPQNFGALLVFTDEDNGKTGPQPAHTGAVRTALVALEQARAVLVNGDFQRGVAMLVALAANAPDISDEFHLTVYCRQLVAPLLARLDWDGDGCADFGDDQARPGCPHLDVRVRPRFYTATVLEVRPGDLPDWKKGMTPIVLRQVEANFAARDIVRRQLLAGDSASASDIRALLGNAIYSESSDEYYRQSALVLGATVDRFPTARDAQALERKAIRSVDILAGAREKLSTQILDHQSGKKPVTAEMLRELEESVAALPSLEQQQLSERQKYLRLFGRGTPWRAKWSADRDLMAQVAASEAQFSAEVEEMRTPRNK